MGLLLCALPLCLQCRQGHFWQREPMTFYLPFLWQRFFCSVKVHIIFMTAVFCFLLERSLVWRWYIPFCFKRERKGREDVWQCWQRECVPVFQYGFCCCLWCCTFSMSCQSGEVLSASFSFLYPNFCSCPVWQEERLGVCQ